MKPEIKAIIDQIVGPFQASTQVVGKDSVRFYSNGHNDCRKQIRQRLEEFFADSIELSGVNGDGLYLYTLPDPIDTHRAIIPRALIFTTEVSK